jgi:hypothetical protein
VLNPSRSADPKPHAWQGVANHRARWLGVEASHARSELTRLPRLKPLAGEVWEPRVRAPRCLAAKYRENRVFGRS